MTQYIDKAAVVAEIERLKDFYDRFDDNIQSVAKYNVLVDILSFLNSLEVKDVDLDYIKDELDRVVKIYKPDGDFGWGTLYNIATHFFELGLKARGGE